MLSDEMVEKFRKIYEKRFGKKITIDEARKHATALLELMKLIYRPIPNPNKKKN